MEQEFHNKISKKWLLKLHYSRILRLLLTLVTHSISYEL